MIFSASLANMVDDIKYFLNNDQDSLKNEILGKSLRIGNLSFLNLIFNILESNFKSN